MDDRSEDGGERTTSDFNELSHLINAHLSDEDRDQVSMKLRDKNQLRRFKVSVEILAQFLDEGLALVEEPRISEYRRGVVVSHGSKNCGLQQSNYGNLDTILSRLRCRSRRLRNPENSQPNDSDSLE